MQVSKFFLLFFPFILLSSCSTTHAQPQSVDAKSTDEELVVQTLNYYLDGGTTNDFQTLKKAFHTNATMKFIGGKGYKEVNALNFFGTNMKPGPKQNRQTKISYLQVSGAAAHAQLIIDYPTSRITDFMNLLKIDGEWKIVSKIFYSEPK